MSLKFSIGIPTYKSDHLYDCISSILTQSFPHFELIIINDCSPHPVAEIVGQFDDPRIRYYENEQNVGVENVVLNFNNCLEKAEGEFFVLMGDDDKMEPDYLEHFLDLIAKYPDLDVFHCRSLIIDEHSNPTTYTPSWPDYETVYDNIWHRLNGKRVQFIADFVFRTDCLKKNGGFFFTPMAWGTDDISAYIAMREKGIAHTNQPLLNYRLHPSNISSSGSHEFKMEAILQQQQWLHNFLKIKPKQKEDLIVYRNICKHIDRLIQKQKIDAIASSLRFLFFESMAFWIANRKRFKISLFEIIYSISFYLRIKRGYNKTASR